MLRKFTGWIEACWTGQASLESAFWLYGFIGTSLAEMPLLALFFQRAAEPSWLHTTAVEIAGAFLFAYAASAQFVIWRCSGNTGSSFFSWFARYTVMGSVALACIYALVLLVHLLRWLFGP